MKTLVVYYSLEGNTKKAAEQIARELRADILPLIPEKEIPREGFAKLMQGGGMASFGLGTKLKKLELDPTNYERIILGMPVWAGKTPPAINQYFKTYKEYDKVAAVFTLSGSGNNASCIKKLKKKCIHLEEIVSLADQHTLPLAEENEEKLSAFIDKIR